MHALSFGLLSLTFLMFPMQSALAHGDATTAQKTVGNYVLELEYSEQGTALAEALIVYNFSILHAKTKEFARFKSVFVRFAAEGDKITIANATLAPDQFNSKNARMGVTLPEEGLYTVTVRFYDEKYEEMAEAAFDLTADPPHDERIFLSVFADYSWIIALIVGVTLGFVATTLRKQGTLQSHV